MTDIFQSPGDRLRFEILLKSLTEGSINLAVLSQHDLVLDFYGSLFEERLRAAGEQNIEFCTSTSSEQLVQTFNDILSELTLNQATEKEKKLAPRRFLLFRDSILMQEFELQLLARLVNGFPAGNISVILLINSAGNYRKKLEAFGKNLLQWEVETKAGEPKRVLSDWVADTPDEELASEPPVLQPMSLEDSEEALKQLNMPKKTSWRIPGLGKKAQPQPAPASVAATATPAPVPASTPYKPQEAASISAFDERTPREPVLGAPVLGAASAASAQAAEADVFKRSASKPRWGMVLFVLLMSLAVFGFMYKDLLVEEAELFKKYLLRGTPAAPSPTPEPVASAPEPAASSAVPAASDVASGAVDMQTNPASGSVVTAPAASEPVVVAPIKEVAVKEAVSKETTNKQVPAKEPEKKEPPKKETQTNAPQADKISDADWVSQLPDDGFVLQLAAFDVEDEMLTFKRSQAAYASARVMQVRKKDTNKRYYILLAGPFETKPDADRFMKSSPLLAKGWLRSVKSVKAQLTKA
ncbi:MAG: SPOR domain-containing protein [Betaproteobacteria bacterium]